MVLGYRHFCDATAVVYHYIYHYVNTHLGYLAPMFSETVVGK